MEKEGRTTNFVLNAFQNVPRVWKIIGIAVLAFLWLALPVNLHRYPDSSAVIGQITGVIVASVLIVIAIIAINAKSSNENTGTDDSSAENDAFGPLESQPLYDYATDPDFMKDTPVS